MSQDHPIPRQDTSADRRADATGVAGGGDATEPGAAVVTWGGTDRDGGRAFRRVGRFGRDGRLVPVVAVLGAGASGTALVEVWAVTTIPSGTVGMDEPVVLSSGVADLAAFGVGYLVAVLGVVGCLALVLFGQPAVRHTARVLGLALSGGALGVLAAVTVSVETIIDRWQAYGELAGVTREFGPGLIQAYLGVAGLGLALLLAGPFVPRTPAPTGAGAAATADPAGPAGPGAAGTGPEPVDWPWRRPRRRADPDPADDGRPGPIDLTVTPTKPFVTPERRHPHD